jgi:formylmethanofuran dehydrogenase subunit E
MKVKQVFSSYNFQEKNSLCKIIYCSSCGSKCVKKTVGDRDRPFCPACGFVHYENPLPQYLFY